MMNSQSTTNQQLTVSMEVTDEYMVQEILNDGTEIYKHPLNMSENFARIIQRIDFDKLSTILSNQDNNNIGPKKDFEIPEIQMNVSSFVNPNQRPSSFCQLAPQFESIKSKIMNALTNISVMYDVMKVAKEPDYLVIEPVAKDPNRMTDEKPITVLVSKKKAIAQAAQLISNALDRLQNEANHASRSRIDFHTELRSMRQNWRLRKKGQNIIGDLSYRGAWSNFSQPATFEVIRNENQQQSGQSSLIVNTPKTLEGGNFYVVRTVKGNLQSNTLFEPLKVSHPQLQNQSNDSQWQTRLEIAQNMLFNNELFKRLAHESVLLKLPIPTIAAGNQILAPLFPGLQLSINLCHPSSQSSSTQYDSVNNNTVLEHTLYQLLHEIHYKNMHFPLPRPTSVTLAINSAKYVAGPRAYDKKTLGQLAQNETILEQVIQQAQHSMLRLRTMCLIDSLAIEIQDPLIIPNWNYLNAPNQTSVRVDLYSYGYEGFSSCRTSVMLHIDTKTVKAIMKDGRVLNLSFESQELRHLLLNLVSHHQIVALQSLAKAMGWKLVSLNSSVGVGKQEPICGTASSLVLISPNGDRTVAVKSGPHSGIKVKLSSSPQEFLPSNLVSNQQWQQLNGQFKIVDWQRLPGKTFVNKMEYMMACLAIKSS
ncbi:mediator complex subunit 17 [Dermatophagoides pteronyssinus]|uniref:mediator complex subunit 17 n=1 Tax=Dermatophagoides pteronyssinus TaxID=6956 RepID=UPI003F679DC0